ncbi:MAG: DegV family protein [Christensenellaceae bacterium]|jgi:DegV family protein with EDD domain|nr:DegV family protein [Christensenellaceae bacterium]
MSKLVFMVDSTCDVPKKFLEDNDVVVLPLNYSIGEEEKAWQCGDDEDFKVFYEKMEKGDLVRTSLVSYVYAYSFMEPYFKNGDDIVFLGLSSGLSSTWQNEFNAGTDLAKKYNCRFFAPDTKQPSAAAYLILKEMVKINNFDLITKEIDKFYKNVSTFFTVSSLSYLHRSGRLSTTATLIGGMLNIKPIITVTKKGTLESIGKVMGKNKSIQTIASQARNINKKYPDCIIVHANVMEDAKMLAEKVQEECEYAKIEICNLGFIIGTHTGPGTLGLCYRK